MSTPIRTASYSGIRVYELTVNGVQVMRRQHDSFVNATQILRAAGLPKPARTKVLERDIAQGVHEKVQGGYAGFQGTWIPLDVAVRVSEEHSVLQELQPLFEYDMTSGEAEKLPSFAKPRKPSSKTNYSSSSDAEPRKKRARRPVSVLSPPPSTKRRHDTTEDEEEDDDDFDEDDFDVEVSKSRRTRRRLEEEAPSYTYDTDTTSSPTLPPSGIRQCAVCGTTETPQWRRGPSGKRSLCNACGVKWSSGRLTVPVNPFYTSTESESSPTSDLDDVDPKTRLLQQQSHSVSQTLKTMEKSTRKLQKLLFQTKFYDRDVDRGYRRVLFDMKRHQVYPASLLFDDLHSSDDIVPDDDSIPTRFGHETLRDRLYEHSSISSFIRAVKRHKHKFHRHLQQASF